MCKIYQCPIFGGLIPCTPSFFFSYVCVYFLEMWCAVIILEGEMQTYSRVRCGGRAPASYGLEPVVVLPMDSNLGLLCNCTIS
jgi:hypothetical protein